MRKYELTIHDHEAIASFRARCNVRLFTAWRKDPTNAGRDTRDCGKSVCNDRELQAILEWARKHTMTAWCAMVGKPSHDFVSFEDVTLHMALARHGKPGTTTRIQPGFQPDFSELPQ